LIGIIVSAGIIAAVSAYLMFKVKDSTMGSSMQALFFFMIIASFIVMGSAGYESRLQCDYVLSNSTVVGNVTNNNYALQCTERASAAGSWVYRLPLWFGYISAGYIIIYFLVLIGRFGKQISDRSKGRGGGDRGFER
jgi:hypothetical protein